MTVDKILTWVVNSAWSRWHHRDYNN